MINIILISIGVALLLTLIVGYPFILTLKPAKNIEFLDIDEDASLVLDETQLESFNAVKLAISEKGDSSTLTFYAKEETSYAYVTICYKSKKKTSVKHFRLNFKKQSEATVLIKDGIENVTFFVNQVNENIYKERVYQSISKGRVATFIALEYVTFLVFMGDMIFYFMNAFKTLQMAMGFGIAFIVVTAVLAIASYPVFHLATKWCLEKYINGGFVNARD